MTKSEVEQIFAPSTFTPLVLTTKDGSALPVTKAGSCLVGLRMIVIKADDRLYQIPFHAIAHVSEQGEHLG
jgi:hypothetical protein